jgi:plastocyanin
MLRVLTVAIAALLIAGCGSDEPTKAGGTAAKADKVNIKDFKYAPASIEVKKGTTVSFTNEDTAKHTATSKPQGTFDSGDISKGQTKPVTFNKAGSYTYYCVYHAFMKGKVKVVD